MSAMVIFNGTPRSEACLDEAVSLTRAAGSCLVVVLEPRLSLVELLLLLGGAGQAGRREAMRQARLEAALERIPSDLAVRFVDGDSAGSWRTALREARRQGCETYVVPRGWSLSRYLARRAGFGVTKVEA